jgi:hypothetical protein
MHSISLVILHLTGIVYNPQKCNFLSQLAIDRESVKTVSAEVWQVYSRCTLIDRSSLIRGRRELWIGLFDSSGHNAYGKALEKSTKYKNFHFCSFRKSVNIVRAYHRHREIRFW